MVTILMMSEKVATLGRFKIKLFQYECYDIIIFDHGITNKILLGESLKCRKKIEA